jgi:benzoyl-CoA reductase subunit B
MTESTRPMEKQLEASRAAAAHQKQWFAQLRKDVFEDGAPYVIANVDAPGDVFQSMDVPVVPNQWWSAVVASRGMTDFYFDGLKNLGYDGKLCRYCSTGLASTLVDAGERAPWGGLPRPAMLVTRLACDCMQRVFSLWAKAFKAPLFLFDSTGASDFQLRWWTDCRANWESFHQTHRLDHMTEQLHDMIALGEEVTGRAFDTARLRRNLELANAQQEYYDQIRTLVAQAPQSPIRIMEAQGTAMLAQWHRGSEWAVEHARGFRDEVADRVQRGIAACPDEKLRLMWVGAGLWHKGGFYQRWEQSHGAVFTWAEYPAFGADAYLRYNLDDPVRALASRYVAIREWLHDPPWAGEWYAEEARRNRIHGAVVLVPTNSRPSSTGSLFIAHALEQAGIPTLLLWADMVDPSGWDDQKIDAQMLQFLEQRVAPNAR